MQQHEHTKRVRLGDSEAAQLSRDDEADGHEVAPALIGGLEDPNVVFMSDRILPPQKATAYPVPEKWVSRTRKGDYIDLSLFAP